MANEYRLTAFYIEALNDGGVGVRVTTYPAEVLHSGNPNTPMRVTTFPIEVLHGGQDSLSFSRVTSYAIEVLRSVSVLVLGGAGRGAQIIA
jgi:hypothetical protein